MSECWKKNCKALIEQLPDGVFFCDQNGTIQYANKSFLQLVGPSKELEPALLAITSFDDQAGLKAFLHRLMHHTQLNDTIEVRMVGEGGSEKWVELSSVPIETEQGYFGVLRNITSYKTLQQELLLQALTDELTGLYNRRGFKMMAEQELEHSHRLKNEIVLLSIDIDAFKAINDSYGHDEGDRVLKLVAETMQRSFRSSDILGRWGGDEFLVLALDAPGGTVEVMTERFNAKLEEIALRNELPFSLTVTIGFAYQGAKKTLTLAQMIQQADTEMYAKKRDGFQVNSH